MKMKMSLEHCKICQIMALITNKAVLKLIGLLQSGYLT